MKQNENLVNEVNGNKILYQGASPDRCPTCEQHGFSRYFIAISRYISKRIKRLTW